MNVTYNVKYYRQKQKISLKKLSDLSGVGKSTINYIECNKHHPTIPTLAMIAKALNVDLEELYTLS